MDDRAARPFFIRNLRAGGVLGRFRVAAVAAVLAVRFFLGLTGFPRLGGGGLHIAHMLWGGGLMVAALLVLLGYLGQRVRRTAAVGAGIGFGLFIDELGKFITSDNNYSSRPLDRAGGDRGLAAEVAGLHRGDPRLGFRTGNQRARRGGRSAAAAGRDGLGRPDPHWAGLSAAAFENPRPAMVQAFTPGIHLPD